MSGKIFGNEYRNTMVFVDSYEGCVLEGRFYNPYLKDALHFSSAIDLIKMIDSMLDDMKFPQAFNSLRRFSSAPVEASDTASLQEHGKLATFNLRIMFRQNSSWQGTVSWVDGRLEESFRSVLELLILMDSALTSEHK